jgi:multidrug efflux pump
VKRSERLTPDQLKDIYVTGTIGGLVPLSTFATVERTPSRATQALPAAQRGSDPGRGSRPASRSMRRCATSRTRRAQILPRGFTSTTPVSRASCARGQQVPRIFLLSAILIFLVLAAQFESFRDPIVILAGSAPLALAGALLFSFLGLTTLNIYSQVGLITLVGLVAKNGILIVQFANHLQETGRSKLESVIEAAGTRLRPILMTTAATVFGHLPLVFATGPGAGARNSIGIMLVSGMIIGTAFTLLVVPAIYMLVAQDAPRAGGGRGARAGGGRRAGPAAI